MKKGVFGLVIIGVLILALSFISASWFSDFFGKTTGKVVDMPTNGLIAYYPFEGNANDMSGNGNNGVIVNNVNCEATGKFGKACSFNGAGYIQASNPTGFSNIGTAFGPMTISAWVKNNKVVNYHQTMVSTEAFRFQIAWENSLVWGWKSSNGATTSYATGMGPFPINTWTHVVGVKTGTYVQWYVNGQKIYNSADLGHTRAISNLRIGVDGLTAIGKDDYFNGTIDEVRIYNRALVDSEIQALYNQTVNPVIVCSANSDCGVPATTTSCDATGNRCTSTTSYTCNNAGTTSSQCVVGVSSGCTPCAYGCLNGACIVPNPSSTELIWNMNSPNCLGFKVADSTASYVLAASTRQDSDINVNLTTIKNVETGNEICVDKRAGDTCTVGNVILTINKVAYSPSNSNLKYVNLSIPSGNLVTNCVQNTQTCFDSDDGLNYYEEGNVTVSLCSVGNNSGGCGGNLVSDGCIIGGLHDGWLREISCSNNQAQMNDYQCPNGCANGACVRPEECTSGVRFAINEGESKAVLVNGKVYSIDLSYISSDSIKLIIDGIATGAMNIGYTYYLENGVLEVESINYQGSAGGIRTANLVIHYNCGSQTCQSLIDRIKFPSDSNLNNGERRVSWNSTYDGDAWVNGQEEHYNVYSAGFYWYSNEYNENQLNYYHVTYDLQVFDNEDVNLSSYATWNQNSPVCKATAHWANGHDNNYYICNWDALYNQQDDSYNGQNREIFWYHDNVLVRMYIYYGQQLTDAQIQLLATQRLIDLMNNLKNNQNQYVDWTNFNIDWPANNEVYNSFEQCTSTMAQLNSLSWSCRTEPVICPEHGEQRRICTAWNPQTQDYQTYDSSITCNPGVCSGCMVPRWFGNNWYSKCIPYGFRFSQQSGTTLQLVEGEEQESLEEQGGDVIVTIDSDTQATLVFLTDSGNYSYNLIEDGSVDISEGLIALEGDDGIVSLVLDVLDVVPSSASSNGIGYVKITMEYQQYRENPVEFNAYCDIDGQVKQQKGKIAGEWSSCQNNYECESNICSYGECVEVRDMFAEVNAFKGTFVKVICRLSHIFNADNYNTCVYNYLGESTISSSTNSGGGGGSTPAA